MEVIAEAQTVIVGNGGRVAIPAEILESLRIVPGTRLMLRVDGTRLIIDPATAKLIDSMQGRFAGGPSMADELQRDRREEGKKW